MTCLTLPAAAQQPSSPPTQLPPLPVEIGGDLRKREHVLSFEYSSTKTKTDFKNIGETESTSGSIEVGYGRNFGRFELGVTYDVSISKVDGGDDSTSGLLGVYGQYNFIPNTPGHDLIPWVGVAYGASAEKSTVSGVDIDANSTGLALGAGLTWFPFGELFAVNASFFSFALSGDGDAGGADFKFDMDQAGLSVSCSLVF